MRLLRILITALACLAIQTGWANESAKPIVDEKNLAQFLNDGVRLSQSGKPNEAIPYFDKAIAGYENAFAGENTKLYCARWQVESLMYMLEAANAKTAAKVVSVNWAYAYYMKAYSLLELGRVDDAKAPLEQAISLSPRNAQFLAEKGNIYQREKNWDKALETFRAAEAAAREFSPPTLKNAELSRALRGIAYVYVEQNKLDDAEKVYRQCLEIDSNDQRALSELRYVQGLKAKSEAQ